MLTSEDIIRMIQDKGDQITAKIIEDLIKDWERPHAQMRKYYERYKGNVPIKNRMSPDRAGIALNNKLQKDWEGIIIDEIVGYIWGHPVKISYNSDNVNDKKVIENFLERFDALNNSDALDEETGELSSLCGYGSRLLYVDTEAQFRAMNTKPWETIFVYNNSTDEVEFALIYYPWVIVDTFGNSKKSMKAEWYDKSEVSYWIKDGGKWRKETFQDSGMIDEMNYKNPQKHMFDYVPVVKYKANNLEQSDLEKATSLIDAYNELISDAQNEIQEFVHCYLKATGAEMSKEERIKARASRVFNLPDKEADIDFITKDINPEFFIHQQKTLKDDIHESTKTVDMNDENFSGGGAESGEARKWKLLALEFKAIKKERRFTEGQRYMFKVLSSGLRKKNINLDHLLLHFTYIRSLPIDYLYYAQIAQQFTGILPKLDVLQLIPFIKDPQAVLDRLNEENNVNLDLIPGQSDIQKMIESAMNKNPNSN